MKIMLQTPSHVQLLAVVLFCIFGYSLQASYFDMVPQTTSLPGYFSGTYQQALETVSHKNGGVGLQPVTLSGHHYLPLQINRAAIDFEELLKRLSPEIFSSSWIEPYLPSIPFPLFNRLARLIREQKEKQQEKIRQSPVSDGSHSQPASPPSIIYTVPHSPEPKILMVIPDVAITAPKIQTSSGQPETMAAIESTPCSLCNNEICNGQINCLEYSRTAAYKGWLEFLHTYINQGVVVKVFTSYRMSFREKINIWLSGGVFSASYLIPGLGNRLFGSNNRIKVALGFLPSDVDLVARFKRDVGSQVETNQAAFSARLFDAFRVAPSGKTAKNHACHYSFINKLREQCLIEDEAMTSERKLTSSGHIESDGSFVAGKPKTIPQRKNKRINEVLVQCPPGPKKMQAIVVTPPFAGDSIRDVGLLLDYLSGNYTALELAAIPVIYFDEQQSAFNYLGSATTVIKLMKEKGGMLDRLFPPKAWESSTRIQLHNKFHDYLEFLDKELGAICQQADIGSDLSWQALLNKKQHCLFGSLMEPMTFVDNIEKLSYAIPLLGGKQEDKKVFLSVLASTLFRQVLEALGEAFSDQEALFLSYAAVVSFWVREIPESLMFFSLLMEEQGADLVIKSDIEQAIMMLTGGVEAHLLSPKALQYSLILSSSWAEESFRLPFGWVYPHAELSFSDSFHLYQSLIINNLKPELYKVISLNKEHTWPLLIQELQNKCREIIANQVRQILPEGAVQNWPYAEMSVMLPEQLSLLEMVAIANYPYSASSVVEQLSQHYAWVGMPLFPGTLRSSQITDAVILAVKRELSKQPDMSLISPALFYVQNRQWEQLRFPWDGVFPF